MDNTGLWLIVVGIATAFMGLGLMYAIWTGSSLARRLKKLDVELKQLKETSPTASVPVEPSQGAELAAKGGDKGKGGKRGGEGEPGMTVDGNDLHSLAVPMLPMKDATSSDAQSGAGVSSSDLLVRIKQLEQDVSELQSGLHTLQQHQPSSTGGDQQLQGAPGGGAASVSTGDASSVRGSRMFEELLTEMRGGSSRLRAAPSGPSTAPPPTLAARLNTLRPNALQTPRRSVSWKGETRGADAGSPTPTAHHGDSSMLLSPVPRTPLEDASQLSMQAGGPLESAGENPLLPDVIHGYAVLEAPPNATGLPDGDVVSLSACSRFEQRKLSIVTNESGAFLLRVAHDRSQRSAGQQSIGDGVIAEHRISDFAAIWITLDELPQQKAPCAVFVFVRTKQAPKTPTSSTSTTCTVSGSFSLPHPKRSSSANRGLNSSTSSTATTTNAQACDNRLIFCAPTMSPSVDVFVQFLDRNFNVTVLRGYRSNDALL